MQSLVSLLSPQVDERHMLTQSIVSMMFADVVGTRPCIVPVYSILELSLPGMLSSSMRGVKLQRAWPSETPANTICGCGGGGGIEGCDRMGGCGIDGTGTLGMDDDDDAYPGSVFMTLYGTLGRRYCCCC